MPTSGAEFGIVDADYAADLLDGIKPASGLHENELHRGHANAGGETTDT